MRRTILVAVALCCFAVAQSANSNSCHAGATENERVMKDAARSLTFPQPDNRAYMLEKHSGADLSQVGVIFGYGDNGAACRDIADTLTERNVLLSKVVGYADKYECNPIDLDR
jgi:hypothetical protein